MIEKIPELRSRNPVKDQEQTSAEEKTREATGDGQCSCRKD
jgi:hypothetical protein